MSPESTNQTVRRKAKETVPHKRETRPLAAEVYKRCLAVWAVKIQRKEQHVYTHFIGRHETYHFCCFKFHFRSFKYQSLVSDWAMKKLPKSDLVLRYVWHPPA